MNLQDKTIAVIGLGYVGLPLAVEFGKVRPVIGFDINPQRITELQGGKDHTLECSSEELAQASQLRYSYTPADLQQAQVFIVTVPTPVDTANRPDMTPLVKASTTVGKALKKGHVVIYESTVYPGATEEVCVPILEQNSGLKFNVDFFCGYSPERINPGDKEHRLPTIKKVTSGSTPAVADAVDALYAQIITAGTYKASSIKVAEAAKVIENTQRDVNIALMNELSLIFHKLGIDTLEVLQAAGTKWNFLPFRPGLVGGHCIGVDPYYLTHKAQEVGYHAEVILAGRRINDGMASHVADEAVKLMLRKGIAVLNSRILVLGLTFKENCPDVRNTKVVDIVKALQAYNTQVDVYDPWIDLQEAEHEYGLHCLPQSPEAGKYSAIVLAVGHHQFVQLGEAGIKAWGITGFLNMLVAARDAQVKSFTYAASSSTYGDHPALPKVEENIGKPLSPYAVTKYVNELYADVFSKCYGFHTIGLRYFNVFGPRQNPNGAYAAVIPKWVSSMLKGETVFINGDGETSRDFTFIQNAIQANLLAASLHGRQALHHLRQRHRGFAHESDGAGDWAGR